MVTRRKTESVEVMDQQRDFLTASVEAPSKPRRRSPMRSACASAVAVAVSLFAAAAAPAHERKDAAKPLPADVVVAWQKAGAEVGWLGPDRAIPFLFFHQSK